MNVGSICKREIVCIDRQRTAQEAAALMRDQHVGALVVTADMPDGKQVAGIVTDRDLVVEALARGLDGSQLSIGLMAGANIVSVVATAGLDEAVKAMQEGGVRRLLVTTGEGKVIGIVSFDDILDALSNQMIGLAKTLRNGLQRERSAHGALAVPSPEGLRVLPVSAAGKRVIHSV